MSKKIYISDYFKYDNTPRSAREFERIYQIRSDIDSYKDEADAAKYIFRRRQSYFNRQEDLRLFGIPLDAEIDEFYTHKENVYYNYKSERYDKVAAGEKDFNIITNLSYRFKNAKSFNNLKIFIKNIKLIMIIIAICSILFTIISIFVFVAGVLNSIGQSPFIIEQNF